MIAALRAGNSLRCSCGWNAVPMLLQLQLYSSERGRQLRGPRRQRGLIDAGLRVSFRLPTWHIAASWAVDDSDQPTVGIPTEPQSTFPSVGVWPLPLSYGENPAQY